MQTPGHTDPPPPPPDAPSTAAPTKDGLTVLTTTNEIQLECQEITTVLLRDILLTMYSNLLYDCPNSTDAMGQWPYT